MTEAVLADWRTAPVRGEMRAMLGFLQKLTLIPAEIGPADIAALREAGIGDAAIHDALAIAYLFNGIDRISDALGFDPMPPHAYGTAARTLLAVGYRIV